MAVDPLENRLAQINEYMRSMEVQLLMGPTKYQEDFTKAYVKVEETETEFCRVIRAEEYSVEQNYVHNAHNHTHVQGSSKSKEPR
jgi:hypothetical protein